MSDGWPFEERCLWCGSQNLEAFLTLVAGGSPVDGEIKCMDCGEKWEESADE